MEDQPKNLFAGDIYHVVSSITTSVRTEVEIVLENGGTRASHIENATIIVTDSLTFEDCERVQSDAILATSKWALRSAVLGKRLDPKFYSPDPCMIFSGVVGCSSDIPAGDREAMAGGIRALGGQWRQGLTKDVTHLFALSPTGEKYQTAVQHKDSLPDLVILLPHWFDDSFSVQQCLRVPPYCFPDPPILRPNAALDALGLTTNADKEHQRSTSGLSDNKRLKEDKLRDREQALLYKSVKLAEADSIALDKVKAGVWGGRRILLSRDLEIDDGRRRAIEASVERGGGVVVKYRATEEAEMNELEILITRYREGNEYDRAIKSRKTVGTLAWLFHVEQSGRMSMPEDQFLHVPVPKDGIKGFSAYEITVTNYSGEAREYLKKLIQATGATFSPTLSARHTHVIAAYKSGTKTSKAEEWNIPVINHTWIEDCLTSWTNINLASGSGKYTKYPGGVNYASILGERGFGHPQTVDLSLRSPAPNVLPPPLISAPPSEPTDQRPPPSTSAPPTLDTEAPGTGKESVRDAMEVEDDLALVDDGEPMDIDVAVPPVSKGKEALRPEHKSKGFTKPITSDVENPPLASTSTAKVPVPPKTAARPKTPPPREPRANRVVVEIDVPMTSPTHRSNASSNSSPVRRTTSDLTPRAKPLSPLKRTATEPAGKILKASTSSTASPLKPRAPSSRYSPETSDTTHSTISAHMKENGRIGSDRPSRSAKAAAVQRIAVGVVDKMKFDKENKESQGDVHKWKDPFLGLAKRSRVDSDDDDVVELTSANKAKRPDAATSKSRRVSSSGKGKAKADVQSADEDAPSEDEAADSEDNVILVKRTSSKKTAPTKLTKPPAKKARLDGDANSDSNSSNRSKSAPGTTRRMKTVKIMTTMITLSAEETKTLEKLGVKMTTNPKECTHLVTKQFSRTEKFLCAIPFCTYVLDVKWIHDSIAAKQLLDEEKFLLQDAASERKYGFKLTDSLLRAQKHRILEGHTFYTTVKDSAVLGKVVVAHGGKLIHQAPTVRVLSNDTKRHVICSPSDKSTWGPIADKGIPIYTPELVYTGVLVQKMSWDDFRVEGSV